MRTANKYKSTKVSVDMQYIKDNQGVIQSVFEIGYRFWARKTRRPNFFPTTKKF